jgi:putative phosphoribosyl transferase
MRAGRRREGDPGSFADRGAAGRVLAEAVAGLGLVGPVVLALPRGGVPVGYEICRRLGVPLEVMVSRKIGHPRQPELGVGAIAEGGMLCWTAK